MAGRPNALPWNFATFSGNEPVTTLSDNFNSLNNIINDSGAGFTSYAIDTGTANNLVVTLASPPVGYEAGMMVCTVPANTNTAASVINVNALGNVSIVSPANTALSGGEIAKNSLLTLVYDGTSFRIIGPNPLEISATYGSGNQTYECAGRTSVSVIAIYTGGANVAILLNHLGSGVPVSITVVNSIGSTQTWFLSASTPAGVGYGLFDLVQAGAATGSPLVSAGSTGASIANGNAMVFTGISNAGGQIILSR